MTVVIPTWNAREELGPCLDGLLGQTRPADQILVVDGASTDGTAEFVEANYPTVTVARQAENLGPAAGMNAGIRLAKGDYIATLDSDAFLTPRWIEAMMAALEADRSYCFAASRILRADGSGRIDCAGQGFDIRLGAVMLGCGELDGPAFDSPREVFGVSHAAAMYTRRILERVGGVDESLFAYSEEIDFAFRARMQGFRCIYVPSAVAYHWGSATGASLSARRVRLIYRNCLTVYLKDMPSPLMRQVWPRTVRLMIGMLHHAPHRKAAMRGVLEAFWRLPDTMRKRRQIQRVRTVGLEGLRSAMIVKRPALAGTET